MSAPFTNRHVKAMHWLSKRPGQLVTYDYIVVNGRTSGSLKTYADLLTLGYVEKYDDVRDVNGYSYTVVFFMLTQKGLNRLQGVPE